MKKNIMYLLGLLIVPVLINSCGDSGNTPEPIGVKPEIKVEVCKWQGDKLSALSITIDDNNEQDIEFWRTMSSRFDFKFTWFLTTESTDAKYNVKCWDCYQKLANEGHSIQAHDDRNWYSDPEKKHLNPTEEEYFKRLERTKNKINSHISNNKCETYAYPWGEGNPAIVKKCYIACRGVMGLLNNMEEVDYFNVNSISSSHLIKDEISMKKYVLPIVDASHKLYKKSYYGGWLSTHFHAVSNVDVQFKIVDFLRFLKSFEEKIWVSTFPQIVKYSRQYASSKLEIKNISAQEVVLAVTDNLDDSIYNEPLTIKVKMPEDWKNIEMLHKGNQIKYTISKSDTEGYYFVLFDISPDQGDIRIIKK